MSIDFEAIEIGATYLRTREICSKDVIDFAEVSGDKNPVHIDEDFAKNTVFKKRIAHGLMSAGMFSAIFGMDFPGPGCVYVSQTLKFLRPVYIGDVVLAEATVSKILESKRRIWFRTQCRVNNKIVMNGIAEIYVPA